MRYQANPVSVEAHRIVSVGQLVDPPNSAGCGYRDLALENGENVTATAGMLARTTPEPGDYWVIQEDGYVYLNPREVFERKYSASTLMESQSSPACRAGSD